MISLYLRKSSIVFQIELLPRLSAWPWHVQQCKTTMSRIMSLHQSWHKLRVHKHHLPFWSIFHTDTRGISSRPSLLTNLCHQTFSNIYKLWWLTYWSITSMNYMHCLYQLIMLFNHIDNISWLSNILNKEKTLFCFLIMVNQLNYVITINAK